MVGLVAELESMPPSGFARVRLRGFEVAVSLGLRLEKRKGFGLVNLGLRGGDEREHRLAERFGAWLSRSIPLLKCFCFLCFWLWTVWSLWRVSVSIGFLRGHEVVTLIFGRQ